MKSLRVFEQKVCEPAPGHHFATSDWRLGAERVTNSFERYDAHRSNTHPSVSGDNNCSMGPAHRPADRDPSRTGQPVLEPVARIAAADPSGPDCGFHALPPTHSVRRRLLHLVEGL